MIKLILSAMLALSMLTATAQQQDTTSYTRDGNNFTAVASTSSRATSAVKTPYTWEVKGVKYPIYLTKRGKCYILRVSEKTGNEYKQYLPADVTAEIVRLMSQN